MLGMNGSQLDQTQKGMKLDDGSGLRVAVVDFQREIPFDWSLFDGFDTLRVLTYSASAGSIVRMLDKHEFKHFECVFGSESTLHDLKNLLAFQQIAIGDIRSAIKGLKDERHARILAQVRNGRARFRVVKKQTAHAKLYLLSKNEDSVTRVIVGSANLSERAFSGLQPETLVMYDDDSEAWSHYSRMYETVKETASEEIALPEERIEEASIELEETPAIADKKSDLIIDRPNEEELKIAVQANRIEKVADAISPHVAKVAPPMRRGKQRITPDIKREVSEIRLAKSGEKPDNRFFSIDRTEGTANLSGKPFSINSSTEGVRNEVDAMLRYFSNFEDNFEGDVSKLQHDYFMLWAWLYLSPFMCDLRSLALIRDQDIIKYPRFAIVYGKPNCGKTSLIDTLMTSMFGAAHTISKQSFTKQRLRNTEVAFKRHPMVFDDVSRAALRDHCHDLIKEEQLHSYDEHSCYVISMNADQKSYPDDIVKRCLMIYTTAALPQFKEAERQSAQKSVQDVRKVLRNGQLYKRYLSETLTKLPSGNLPEDWLEFSTGILLGVISEFSRVGTPDWCRLTRWNDYTNQRHDRIKEQLRNLLSPERRNNDEDSTEGWKLQDNKVVVWEQTDNFGRRPFDWESVPSTVLDENAQVGGRTVLFRPQLEEFLDHPVGGGKTSWNRLFPWIKSS